MYYMDLTLQYYAENADPFAADTFFLDFSAIQNRFLSYLPPAAPPPDECTILDFGCGSGRDAKAFKEKGYFVTAVDGSPEICALASSYTGIPVRPMIFRELDEHEVFNGIWACASILHAPSGELPEIFQRMIAALKPGGILYVSFKYGKFEGERNGRWYVDFTEETFGAFIREFPELTIVDQWVSSDVRPGRGLETWLNVILKKAE